MERTRIGVKTTARYSMPKLQLIFMTVNASAPLKTKFANMRARIAEILLRVKEFKGLWSKRARDGSSIPGPVVSTGATSNFGPPRFLEAEYCLASFASVRNSLRYRSSTERQTLVSAVPHHDPPNVGGVRLAAAWAGSGTSSRRSCGSKTWTS